MGHAIHRVRSFRIVGPYCIEVTFEDDVVRTVDLQPILKGELFGPLRDRSTFEQVRIDPEAGTLVWPNGADLDPATLHNWPEVAETFATMAAGWKDEPR